MDCAKRTIDPLYEPGPTTPTDLRPGSKQKVAELIRRCEAGEDLWHPEDVTAFRDRFPWSLPVVKDCEIELEDAGPEL